MNVAASARCLTLDTSLRRDINQVTDKSNLQLGSAMLAGNTCSDAGLLFTAPLHCNALAEFGVHPGDFNRSIQSLVGTTWVLPQPSV